MPHQHDDSCGHDIESHDHDQDAAGPQDNLYMHIDRSNVVALNTVQEGSVVIKPWHQRLDETKVSSIYDSWNFYLLYAAFDSHWNPTQMIKCTYLQNVTPTQFDFRGYPDD